MICKKCNLEKCKSEFYKSTRTTSGYRGACKTCCANDAKKRYDKNKNFVGYNQKNLPIPDFEFLRSNFDYHEDGFLIRKTPRGNQKAGSIIKGKKEKTGYLRIPIEYDLFVYHRVIWKWHNNSEPEFIDHINRNRTDNRIENLRAVTKEQNGRNRELSKLNKSGFGGISEYHFNAQFKWAWRYRFDGKYIHGYENTILKAVEAMTDSMINCDCDFIKNRAQEMRNKLIEICK